MRGPQDIGGLPAGPVEPVDEPIQYWHMQQEAMRLLLGDAQRRMLSVDEVRRGFESFSPEKYASLGFYERRLESMLDILVEKGIIDREEFERRVARELAARKPA
jgi:L-fucose isomerase-like protein